jgi:PilZ domain
MTPSESEFAAGAAFGASASSRQEVRCAVRFPIALPVMLGTNNGDVPARTKNISANGALFELDERISPGVSIRFALRMPGSVLGTPHDVLVRCAGRVVRCSSSQHLWIAAATIDEYAFEEQ